MLLLLPPLLFLFLSLLLYRSLYHCISSEAVERRPCRPMRQVIIIIITVITVVIITVIVLIILIISLFVSLHQQRGRGAPLRRLMRHFVLFYLQRCMHVYT